MRGISTTKHTRKEYDYSVDSNVYFKVKNVRDSLNIDIFKDILLKKSGEKEFFELTNRYKPASITKTWFEEFIYNLINKTNN